jgi:DNA-binding response OmpR family regulator
MGRQKVILVEDDEILSKVIFEELREAGFQVWQAGNGEEGLKLIREHMPDLVLLDVLMPKMDGFALLQLGSDDDIKKGLQMGANDYIVKSQHAVAEIVEKVKGFFAKESHPDGKAPAA